MKYSIKTLKNGLRVLVVPMKDNPTVTVLTLVGTGSDYETKDLNGISHFLEHMCFKGTTRRPTSSIISHELDSLGCEYNAFTDHEITGYYAKGDSKHFKKLLDVIGDIYLNSTFPKDEIEKEKGVIIEEINMYQDMPIRDIYEVFDSLVFGDTPFGRSIAGTKESVTSMTRDQFVNYKKSQYTAQNTVVVVAGNVEAGATFKEIEKTFTNLGNKTPKPKSKSKIVTNSILQIKHKKTDQTHLMLGIDGFPRNHDKNKTLKILSAILGAGMSSRLFNKLREEMGVCYYVNSHVLTRRDTGFLTINVGVKTEMLQVVTQVILDEIKDLAINPVSDKELNKVKNLLIGNMKLGLEGSDDVASFLGSQLVLNGSVKNIKDKEKDILAIKKEDIKKLAKEISKNKNLHIAIIGPESLKFNPKTLSLN